MKHSIVFFGNVHKVSNKYFILEKQVLDNDNIILYTNNIRVIKGNHVLVIDDNKAVCLKDWSITGIRFRNNYAETYAVKINRNYFKPYTFRNNIDNNLSFGKQYSFDDLKKIAKSQENGKQNVTTLRLRITNQNITIY